MLWKMGFLRVSQHLLLVFLLIGLHLRNSNAAGNATSKFAVYSKKSSDEVASLPGQNRIGKDLLKAFNVTLDDFSNSTNTQQKRSSLPSTARVQIIEAGSRSRGEARVLKRGGSTSGSPGAPGSSRFSVSTRQNGRNGYDNGISSLSSSSSVESLGSFQVISIPGSNIPPPVYSYEHSPPAPSSLIITGSPGGSGGSYGSYKPSGSGGGFASSTTKPEIIFPPQVVTPPIPGPGGPKPIGPPGPGTSVPIIGGGGGSSIFPPSPPPEDIFPPAPPPDDEFFGEVGRRLKVGARSGVGAPGAPGVGVRTRTRIIPSSRVTSSSRFSTSDAVSATDKLSGRGGSLRREKLRDRIKFKTGLVEEADEQISEEMIADDPNIITDFVFSDIKCFKTRQNEYFGATIHMKNGFHLPYIRDRPHDTLRTEECRLDQVEGTRGSYHMTVTDLRGCGVEQCGESMCLTMVFPRVPILALADDEVTTIKCIPQKSTISDMKTISFAGDSTENRRSSSTVEGGIQEFVAEVGIFRQNPGSTNGLFVKRVSSGGVVQLGEPLQLRSVVRGTDGWKHSKLTDVKVWRMRDNLQQNLENLDPNQASEVITLVDAHGCRNDEYLVIADDHPIRDPRNDMIHHFTFKAFLFRGQRVNEPLIVTARVHACQELHDCVMECETGVRRQKRSPIEHHNASAIVHDFDSQLALRVVGLKDHPSSIIDDNQFPFDYKTNSNQLNKTVVDPGSMTCNEKMFATGLGGGCIMLLICGLGLALFTYVKQGRIHYSKSKATASHRGGGRGGGGGYRYPPPPGRLHPLSTTTPSPYQKPLPPPPSTQPQPPSQSSTSASNSNNTDGKTMNDISQVAKLLQELAKSNSNSDSGGKKASSTSGKSSGKESVKKEQVSEYACIDETSSPTSSSSSSEVDLTKAKSTKDGVYILYCYNKDKKDKLMLPLSAPSSTRLKRKNIKGKERNILDDEDDFVCQDEDSETMASQTEDATESDDSYEDKKSGKASGGNVTNLISKNQGCRRTVREVKKKSKQNNCVTGGIIRRRVSSVYREGYLNGIKGAVAAAVGSKGGPFPLSKYRKSPSTGNLPEAVGNSKNTSGYSNSSSGKRINFSVRERRSARKRRQQKHNYDYSTSEGMLSEATIGSDLDSAYSGSNCSKLTEDQLYELKRGGAGHYPDFHNFHKQQNLLDVQRQLRRSIAQGRFSQKQQVRRTSSSPNDTLDRNTTAVSIGSGSPPLLLGETKATHFVTRDDSSTKILIVPETHV